MVRSRIGDMGEAARRKREKRELLVRAAEILSGSPGSEHLTRKEIALAVIGIALSLGQFASSDPVVVIPMLGLALIAFIYLLVIHGGPKSKRIFIGICIAGTLAFVGIRATPILRSSPRVRGQIVVAWGSVEGCREDINGKALMDYQDKYKVAFICGLKDDTKDKFEDEDVTVSSLFTIRPSIEIRVPLSSKMAARKAATRSTAIWYETILLPNGTDVSLIHRVSDVPRYGGKILIFEPSANDGDPEHGP